jgi:hypothetical protein
MTGQHHARQRPDQPNRGRQSCRTCGRPIVRRGRHLASDGVRGQWRHEPLTPAQRRILAEIQSFGKTGRDYTGRSRAAIVALVDAGFVRAQFDPPAGGQGAQRITVWPRPWPVGRP